MNKLNKKLIAALCIGASFSMPVEASLADLYRIKKSPYAATLAHKIGDILTVKVSEVATTNDNASSDTTRNSNHGFDITKFFFPGLSLSKGFTDTMGSGDNPGIAFNNASSFDSESKNSSNHNFYTTIPVRIIEEVSEGQYVIRGKRLLNINGKEKTLFISGVIRQEDISSSNEVESDKVVDAVVEMDGEIASKELKAGFLTRFYNLIF